MTIFGVDLSDFDRGRGPVDVASMARDGIVFLTHKATEGTSIRHAYYGQTLNAARAAGIPILGAYFVPRTPGNAGHGTIPQQAAYFLAYLDAQTPWWRSMPEFFIQVDTEHWGYDDVAPQFGAQAAGLLRAHAGKFVIHYAPRWAYGDTIPGGEPLWASSYGTNPIVPYRQGYPGDGSSGWAPYSGRVPTFLQYGSQLRIGSQPGCDANAFRGTLPQLIALVRGDTDLDANQAAQLADIAAKVNAINWTTTQIPINGARKELHVVLSDLVGKVESLTAAVATILTNQGATQADIDALLARPTATLTITPETVQPLAEALSAVLVAHPDTPLGEADQPAIMAALDKFFHTHFGEPAPAAGGQG